VADRAARLNADCHAAVVDRAALEGALRAQGEDFFLAVSEHRPHLFADAAVFISAAQMEQMRGVIAAVERVAGLPEWLSDSPLSQPLSRKREGGVGWGVFLGYDFHLNADGARLIEINTNAGGAFLNALLLQSQRGTAMPGEPAAQDDLERVFLEMFRNEWRLARGDAPLHDVAIVDERPGEQYLYPEFVLAQRMFERAGLCVWILDPSELEVRDDGLCHGGEKIDLIYNRLTDFDLQRHPTLSAAWHQDRVVLTPHPHAYARYADKRNLARLTDADALRAMGADDKTIATLQAGIPQTRTVHAAEHDAWWAERKQWFFKPLAGYGGKGAYRGANLTHRVFEDIMRDGYVAQRFAAPGERMVCAEGAEPAPLKSDVRCFVYGGEVQLVAARLYQGQATNFRTPGGGFAPVRMVG
jgi:glutathione synthase/RimK-type ligase-like ATP-grasp enzyme